MNNTNNQIRLFQDKIIQLENNINIIKKNHEDVGKDAKTLFDKCTKYKLA